MPAVRPPSVTRNTLIPDELIRPILATLILLGSIALALAPRPEAQVLLCAAAPSPAVCDLALVPLVGAENVAESWPDMAPPDEYRANRRPIDPPPLPPRRPWWRRVLDLLVASAHASAPPPDALTEGKIALASGAPAAAWRACTRAAADKKQSPGRRAAALVCVGRAALAMKWTAPAAAAASQAIALTDCTDAHLLLADALRAAGDYRAARRAYLIVKFTADLIEAYFEVKVLRETFSAFVRRALAREIAARRLIWDREAAHA